jgi:2-phospho-L-lactate/phosphoenolpyruvate guanylyltransferase
LNAALVPVARLGAAKSRLLGRLARGELDALVLAMLADVLAALQRTPEVARVAVVTPDATVAEAAEAAGAQALLRHDPGLNPALDAGLARLVAEGATTLLVLLGDVAGARAEDLAALYAELRALGGRGVVLAPSRDGGTSALLRAPPDAIGHRFGPESARAHEAEARRCGAAFRRVFLPSLAVDLDRPEDLEALGASDLPATHTRALLARLGAQARP